MLSEKSKKFLYKLLETPSISGYETPIQKVVKAYASEFADKIEIDLHGNLIAGVNVKAERRILLDGHCDQIGFLVKYISADGFLSVMPIGGIDFGVVPGSRAVIHTAKEKIDGVFGRKPIHMQSADERSKMTIGANENWIDIGAKDKKQAEKFVQIGDPVTFVLGVTDLKNNLLASPGLDNRVGIFTAFESLRVLSKIKGKYAVYAVSAVQEEVGLRGATTAAYSVNPEIGIGIDVTFATDNPGSGQIKTYDIKLGSGPAVSRGPNTNPIVLKQFLQVAKEKKIPNQIALDGRPGGNDTAAIQLTRGGVATLHIGIPNRYMHTQAEVCSLDDLENAVKLISEFVKSLKPNQSFIPH